MSEPAGAKLSLAQPRTPIGEPDSTQKSIPADLQGTALLTATHRRHFRSRLCSPIWATARCQPKSNGSMGGLKHPPLHRMSSGTPKVAGMAPTLPPSWRPSVGSLAGGRGGNLPIVSKVDPDGTLPPPLASLYAVSLNTIQKLDMRCVCEPPRPSPRRAATGGAHK